MSVHSSPTLFISLCLRLQLLVVCNYLYIPATASSALSKDGGSLLKVTAAVAPSMMSLEGDTCYNVAAEVSSEMEDGSWMYTTLVITE